MNFGDLILVFFRHSFGLIDAIVFWLINVVYNLLISLAETTVINDDIMKQFATNIYALIGVFMLFKVSFSILSYLVNPDEFSDKTRGASKLVSNTLVTLVLLVVVPWIFDQAYSLQSIILRDNTIGKIFSSVGAGNTISYSYNAGATMAYDVGTAFLFINESNYLDDDGEEVCEGIHTGTIVYEDKGIECKEQLGLDDVQFNGLLEFMTVTYQTKNGILYFGSTNLILGSLLGHVDSNGDFIFTYHFGISTIVGGFVAWILFMFCFDVAVRSVKLGFLEMIAPVPILSRLDPKKGTEVFNKWLKTVLSTFLDLFIRLLAIYFAIFVIAQVSTQYLSGEGLTNNVTGENVVSFDPFFHVFIILGALLFAKQMPKLVKDLTGLDLSGNFTLNPMKKLSEVPLAGKAIHGTAGAIDSARHGDDWKKGFMKNQAEVPLFGGDGKKAVGWDTIDRRMRKDVDKSRDTAKQRYEAKKNLEDARDMYDRGLESTRNAKDLNNFTDYKKAGFVSEDFIKSAMNVSKNKQNLDKAKVEARHTSAEFNKAQNLLANLEASNQHLASQFQNYKETGGQGPLSEALLKSGLLEAFQNTNDTRQADDAAQKNLEKLTKVQSAFEKTHDQISNIYTQDKELEQARKSVGGFDSNNNANNPRP